MHIQYVVVFLLLTCKPLTLGIIFDICLMLFCWIWNRSYLNEAPKSIHSYFDFPKNGLNTSTCNKGCQTARLKSVMLVDDYHLNGVRTFLVKIQVIYLVHHRHLYASAFLSGFIVEVSFPCVCVNICETLITINC